MMSFFAYALLVIGVPMYLGAFAGFATAPLAWVFPDSKKRAALEILKILQGVVAIGAALLLFRMCSVPTSIWVLVLPLIWITIYNWTFNQPFLSWLMFVIGIMSGWFLCFPSLHL